MKSKYLTSAFWLIVSSALVKIIGAFFKIPLTAYIGAQGRGYFATAYNLYIPVHAVVMGALPIAVSRLISKYNALGNKEMLSSIKKGGDGVFLITGAVSSVLIVLCAKPYCVFIAHSENSFYTSAVLAFSLLFSCLSGSYRGYFEGLMNMKPTAVSQTLEAVFKLVLGLLFAKYTMLRLKAQGIDNVYPQTSAAAMLGVTLGSFMSLLYLFICYRINRDKTLPKGNAEKGRRELLKFSFPIMISCAIQSVFQFLDTASIQYSISELGETQLNKLMGIKTDDICSYAYGVFNTALDFKNLITGVTMALGVTAVPAICRVYEEKNYDYLNMLTNRVFKYTCVLSLYAGGFIFLCSKDILTLFYSKTASDIVNLSDKLTGYFALSSVFYSLASTAVFVVQALGVPERSIKSYIVSGTVRIMLNIVLIKYFFLNGAVIAGALGYFVLFIMNLSVIKRASGVKADIKSVLVKPAGIAVLAVFLCNLLYSTVNYNNFFLVNLLIEFALFSLIYYILCLITGIFKFDTYILIKKVKKMA
ncbi:MAG: oligosaccharide flippase family protein [Eubacterium sp.]|nr:oligosaccharide flippase family protein [Eubacterium sp.]